MAKKGVRNYLLFIEDILESINKINRYTKRISFEKFSQDDKTKDAVVRNFEIIGEAAKQLPEEIKNRFPDVEWKSMIDFRNVIIHEYFGIDLDIMWNIIKTKLPPLKSKIQKIPKASVRNNKK